MTDEQIIYLGPEEELTSVRERLERANAGRIILVIPPQTQLRSHVGWRLLHSRMRELGKDVLVISSDRQVRAVAKAAGFRVADSQESPVSGRSRPGSRPGRTASGGRTLQRSRNQPTRGGQESRPLRPRPQPNKSSLASNERQQAQREAGNKTSRADETFTGLGGEAALPTFDMPGRQFGSIYDLHTDTSPSISPLLPQREDDEPDPYQEDFDVARRIREAAQGGKRDVVPPAAREPSNSKGEQYGAILPANERDEDPFAYMEDSLPVSLPEQRGSTYIEDEIDTGVPDIQDIPTDVHEAKIEDLGDEGDFVVRPGSSSRSPSEPAMEEPDLAESPHAQNMTPYESHAGNMQRPPFQNLDDEELLPIPDQPTRMTPSPAASKRGPQPIMTPQTRNVQTRPPSQQTRKPAKGSRPAGLSPSPSSKRASLGSNRRNTRITAMVFISLVVLVLAVLVFLYFGSNATVTITVPSQLLSQNLQFAASTDQHDTAHNTIPSQVLTFNASATGEGTATGTTKQGNATATGTVIFTNKGSQQLDIPTGTVISTSGAVAVQFVTTADALILPVSSSNVAPPVPVQAQIPGDSGNVAANSISVIPPDSLGKIAQNNGIAKTSVNLAVINPNPMSGGGAGSVQAVTSNDINTLAKALHQQIQTQIKNWLAKVVQTNDVRGKLMPDVLGGPNPLTEETLIATPTTGQAATNGKFSGVLSVNVSILVIRWTAIQVAAKTQLNVRAQKQAPVSVLAGPPTVNITKVSPSSDGTKLSITVTAQGQIVQQISPQDISNQLAGKGIDQARSDIQNGGLGIKDVIGTPRIDMFPGFLGIMPFRPEHIQIIVQPGPVRGTPNG
jgi:hypothetical protein